jgi:predicted AAA+ superfamily ATPase
MQLTEVLADQNPWWTDASRSATRLLQRRALQSLVSRRIADFENRRAILVVGPRQVGKTTILLQTIDDLVSGGYPSANVVYFDFSDDRVLDPVSAREVLDAIPSSRDPNLPLILCLDEVARSINWDRFLKQMVDSTEHRILATDSSASILRDGSRESGLGRWEEHIVEGLTFREFLQLASQPGSTPEQSLRANPGLFERYLRWGGFPEHVSNDDLLEVRRLVRSDVVDRAILRDLLRHNVHVDRARTVFVYLVQNSGGILADSTIANRVDAGAETVSRWIQLLEDTLLIHRLHRFGEAPSSQLGSRPKYYASDHALVSAFGLSEQEDSGTRARIFECVAFRHLREQVRLWSPREECRISYFRTPRGLESDFVLSVGDKSLVVEVSTSAGASDRRIDRIQRVTRQVGCPRSVFLHAGTARDTRGNVKLIPMREYLLDPDMIAEFLG